MRSNPTCGLFYVTTGTWNRDRNLQARLDQGKTDLENTSLFSTVRTEAYGATEIQKLYRQSKETITGEIDFPNKVTLPDITGVQQAFIGIVPVSVLFQLIIDDAGNIRRSVFEDNIRDFQGDTRVNDGIRDTLRSAERCQTFVVLNNGITVVCRALQLTGNKCVLNGFQIVNGCQTSTVLYNHRGAFDPDRVLVPLKLVSTENDEIVNAIIRATNSQNAVKPEELEAMTDFQKKLEAYYRTFTGPGALFYERRSKQWMSSQVEKTRVVTIPNQIKSLASMFLDLPHRVSGYYGTVRSRIGDKLFRSEHKLIPYYTSAFTLYWVDCLFRNRTLDPRFKPLRWFLLMLFRKSVAGDCPGLSHKRIDKYCEDIVERLVNPEMATSAFRKIVGVLEAKGLPEINKDTLKTQSLRDKLVELLGP